MLRTVVSLCACALLGLVFFIGEGQGAPQKNQMVKGTIKVVDSSKSLLVVNQKVKNEFVDRELSILDTTEFVVTIKGKKETANGKAGLQLLEGHEKAQVQIKCDKDVNVLKVTVNIK
jgi:hypothetical protein